MRCIQRTSKKLCFYKINKQTVEGYHTLDMMSSGGLNNSYKAQKYMTNDKERVRVYEKIRDELTKIQTSNAENFDRSILTLSSAGLGISLVFLDKLINISNAQFKPLLYLSWILFVLTIVTTLISYIMGQKGIKVHLNFAEKYYLDEDESYLLKKNKFQKFVDVYAYFTISFFISAIIFLMIFIFINIPKGETKMADEIKSKKELLTDSVTINNLQKVQSNDLKKSVPINNLQPVEPPAKTTSTESSTQTNTSGSKSESSK